MRAGNATRAPCRVLVGVTFTAPVAWCSPLWTTARDAPPGAAFDHLTPVEWSGQAASEVRPAPDHRPYDNMDGQRRRHPPRSHHAGRKEMHITAQRRSGG